jgi:hypothetical protein
LFSSCGAGGILWYPAPKVRGSFSLNNVGGGSPCLHA